MPNPLISFATQADLPALCDLLTALFTLEQDFTPDRVRQTEGLHLLLNNPQFGRLFVARMDHRVVAMANVLINISTAEGGRVAVLEDVIVAQEYRGQGLGRRLVEHVLAWCTAEGLSRVTLLADRDNVPALAFYRHLGFEPSNMTVLRRSLR